MTQVERATTVATPAGSAPSERGQGRQLRSPNSLPDEQSLPKHQKQQQTESQRIYWQQWLLSSSSSSSTSSNDKSNANRHQRQRQLITSSAAVRIDRFSAKSSDVTQLLRKTLHLGHSHSHIRPPPPQQQEQDNDSLVLVATIHNLPSNYVQFEHEVTYTDIITLEEKKGRPTSSRCGGGGGGSGGGGDGVHGDDNGDGQNTNVNNNKIVSSSFVSGSRATALRLGGVGEPFHIVHTLQPDDSPLMKRDEVLDYIQTHILDVVVSTTTHDDELELIVGGGGDDEKVEVEEEDDDDPKPTVSTRFYYVPTNQQQQHSSPTSRASGIGGSKSGSDSGPGSSMSPSSTTIPACIELDGYVTSMDESYDSHNNENDHQRQRNGGDDGDGDLSSFDGSDEEEEDMEDEIYGFGSIDSAEEWDRRRRRSWQLRYRHHHHQQRVGSDIPSIPQKSSLVGHTTTSLSTADSSSDSPRRSQQQIARRKDRRAMRRYLQVSQSHASPTCLSGFVLKQSTKDKHVWKRVYCVLTDDYLWFVPRLQTYNKKKKENLVRRQNESDGENYASGRGGYDDHDDDNLIIKMAPHHGRIMLSRALLIEGMEDMQGSSLFRIPNSWEVVTGKGVTHTFRVQSPSLARQWIHAIRQRLLECYEQSLMQNAELIITDEVVARNHRFRSVAVDPLIAKWNAQQLNEEKEEKNENGCRFITPTEDEIRNHLPRLLHRLPVHSKEQFQANVLRFGLEVASYKEKCLHLQSLLLSQAGEGGSSRDVARVDSAVLSQEIWGNASFLLCCAKDISSQVKIIVSPGTNMRSSSMMSLISVESSSSIHEQGEKNTTDVATSHHSHSSRSLETLCRHIDYVITGQFHHHEHVVDSNNSVHDSSVGRTTHRPSHHNSNDPPPMDLFDMLLKELQNIATQ